MRRNYLIIAIVCWLIAAWAATGWTENMFFHNDKLILERESPHGTEYYEAYVANKIEIRNAVKVGVCNGKDIIHVVSNNTELKKDLAYIGSSYKGMKDAPLFGQCIHDGVHETAYEAEELVEGEMKMVTKRIKTKAWKDKGSPPVKKSERIPHVYFGVDVE